MRIVGVTGYAQHGKDTLAARLVERHGYTRFAFADALKSMALALDPLIDLHPAPGAERGPRVIAVQRLSFMVSTYGWEAAKRNAEVRRFLQVLGTEGVRDHIGEDSWVKACERAIRASGADRAVISDVRFPNEAAWVHSVGGWMVRVVRPDFDNGIGTDHPSEQHIAGLSVDFTARNVGDLTDLCLLADGIARDVEEGFGAVLSVPVSAELRDDDLADITTAYESEVHEALQRRYQGEGR